VKVCLLALLAFTYRTVSHDLACYRRRSPLLNANEYDRWPDLRQVLGVRRSSIEHILACVSAARPGNPDTWFLLLLSQPTGLCAVGIRYMLNMSCSSPRGSLQAQSADVCSIDPTADTRGPQASRHSHLDVILLGPAPFNIVNGSRMIVCPSLASLPLLHPLR